MPRAIPAPADKPEEVASTLCAKATPPRGSYMAQSMVLRDVKMFDKNYLVPTETLVRHLDGTQSLERSPRLSLDLAASCQHSSNLVAESVRNYSEEEEEYGGAGSLARADRRRRSDSHAAAAGGGGAKPASGGPGASPAQRARAGTSGSEADAGPCSPSSSSAAMLAGARPQGLFASSPGSGLHPHRHSLPTSPEKNLASLRCKQQQLKAAGAEPEPATTEAAAEAGENAGGPGIRTGAPTKHKGKGKSALSKWRRKLPLLKALRDEEVCKIMPGLYVGGVGGAKNRDKLLECGITHVVNASPVIPCFYEDDFKYLLLSGFYDQSSENIDEMIELSNTFIRDALVATKGGAGAVYVHCYAGVSRSATLCIAYLMCHCGLPFLEAMRTVRRARPVVCPNTGFMEQLQVYEQRLNLEREISKKLGEQIQSTLMISERDDDRDHSPSSRPRRKDHCDRDPDRAEIAGDGGPPTAEGRRENLTISLDAGPRPGGADAMELATPVLLAQQAKKETPCRKDLPSCLEVKQELVFDMDLELEEPPVQQAEHGLAKNKLKAAAASGNGAAATEREGGDQQESASSPPFAYIQMQ